jgi:hypothetical protein
MLGIVTVTSIDRLDSSVHAYSTNNSIPEKHLQALSDMDDFLRDWLIQYLVLLALPIEKIAGLIT